MSRQWSDEGDGHGLEQRAFPHPIFTQQNDPAAVVVTVMRKVKLGIFKALDILDSKLAQIHVCCSSRITELR
ncbi:MAG: hypothetical protein WBX00_22900, partial [Isosphaeraceae bacterium]